MCYTYLHFTHMWTFTEIHLLILKHFVEGKRLILNSAFLSGSTNNNKWKFMQSK